MKFDPTQAPGNLQETSTNKGMESGEKPILTAEQQQALDERFAVKQPEGPLHNSQVRAFEAVQSQKEQAILDNQEAVNVEEAAAKKKKLEAATGGIFAGKNGIDNVKAMLSLYAIQGEESNFSAASWDKYEKVIQEKASSLPDGKLKTLILSLANNQSNHALSALTHGPLTKETIVAKAVSGFEKSSGLTKPGAVLTKELEDERNRVRVDAEQKAEKLVATRKEATREATQILDAYDEDLKYNLGL